jgi:hypothetical protein
MIKTIQNWLDTRKQYKIEQQRQELINAAKVIISDIMRELVKYEIKFQFAYTESSNTKTAICGITYGYGGTERNGIDLDLCVYHDKIKIELGEATIATYETASWWQKMRHQRNLKKFIYTEDAVKAISNMIIMGKAI